MKVVLLVAGSLILSGCGVAQAQSAARATEYTYVANTSPVIFNQRVNEMIRAGWRPQGGIARSCSRNSCSLFQAMVR